MAANSAAICGCWRSHSSTKTDCDLAPRTFSSAAMRLGEKAREKLTFFCSASKRGRLIDDLHNMSYVRPAAAKLHDDGRLALGDQRLEHVGVPIFDTCCSIVIDANEIKDAPVNLLKGQRRIGDRTFVHVPYRVSYPG